jgi:hypothetical protein
MKGVKTVKGELKEQMTRPYFRLFKKLTIRSTAIKETAHALLSQEKQVRSM